MDASSIPGMSASRQHGRHVAKDVVDAVCKLAELCMQKAGKHGKANGGPGARAYARRLCSTLVEASLERYAERKQPLVFLPRPQ